MVEIRSHCTVGYSMASNKHVFEAVLIFTLITLFLYLDKEFMIVYDAENETLFHFSMLPLVSVPNV